MRDRDSRTIANAMPRLGAWVLGLVYSGTLLAAPVLAEEDPQLLVFISLSMPAVALESWQKDALQYEARLVLRGFVKDSLKATVKALRFTEHTGDQTRATVLPVQIDPIAYTRYGITHVPAVVLAQGERFDVVTGNAGIRAALAVISEQGDLAQIARTWLATHERHI